MSSFFGIKFEKVRGVIKNKIGEMEGSKGLKHHFVPWTYQVDGELNELKDKEIELDNTTVGWPNHVWMH